MKLNVIGLIAALIALISIILPWYSFSYSFITVNLSLWDFMSGFGGLGLGAITAQTGLLIGALALLVIGGLLGLLGNFIIGSRGKTLLAIGGILVILAPIMFAAALVSSGLPLFGSLSAGDYTISVYISFGFFLAFIAAILMFISLRKHPMEAEAAPFAPVAPTPPPPPQ